MPGMSTSSSSAFSATRARWTRRRAPLFAHWSPPESKQCRRPVAQRRTPCAPTDTSAAIAAFNLAESIRRFGHLAARLDPLGINEPIGDPSLTPESHGLTTRRSARLPASIVGGAAAEGAGNALRPSRSCASIYCATTGHDYNHVFVPEERVWLRNAVETGQFRPPQRPDQRAWNCSTASPRSRCSSASCIARSRARRASRSRDST